jgi:hypothetical protein
MQREGIPRGSNRGGLFLSMARVSAVITLVVFCLSLLPAFSEHGFLMISISLAGAATFLIFNTSVAQKKPKDPRVQLPRIIRIIMAICITIPMVYVFINMTDWMESGQNEKYGMV